MTSNNQPRPDQSTGADSVRGLWDARDRAKAALSKPADTGGGEDKLTALFAAAMYEGFQMEPDQLAAREPACRVFAKRALAALSSDTGEGSHAAKEVAAAPPLSPVEQASDCPGCGVPPLDLHADDCPVVNA